MVSPHYIRIFWRRMSLLISPENACLRFFGLPLWRRYLRCCVRLFERQSILLAIWCQSCSLDLPSAWGRKSAIAVEFLVSGLSLRYSCLAITAIFCRAWAQNIRWHYPFSSHFFWYLFVVHVARINQRSEWLNRQWHSQAMTDPLTQLYLTCVRWNNFFTGCGQSVCYLRMENATEFLSRHYGMQMRVHCDARCFACCSRCCWKKGENFPSAGRWVLLVL